VPDDAAALTAEDEASADGDDEPLRTAGGVVPAGAVADAGPVWSTESGYWRVAPERPAGLAENQFPLEVLMADPSGHVTLYLGAVGNGRIDLASDVVVRTSTAAEIAASKRLYGLVNGELMWAWDLAAFGHPMQTYASARLSRVEVAG
jgi:hypothetical protein